ncbi:MAG TPA: hypothetical protein VFW86_02505, partial [Candidatus Limnocylindrales bacterium]|nr:hypothetical protein [Candidatus Limnocylindrales bacterium]
TESRVHLMEVFIMTQVPGRTAGEPSRPSLGSIALDALLRMAIRDADGAGRDGAIEYDAARRPTGFWMQVGEELVRVRLDWPTAVAADPHPGDNFPTPYLGR